VNSRPSAISATTDDGSTPRIAVVGCGYWGRNLVRNFADLGALDWICDDDQAALDVQLSQYPTVRASTSLESLLGEPDVGAVVIASPAACHYDHASRAIRAGKDVFVEKPLALTYAEGERLVEMSRRASRILMVGHVLEYHPAIDALKSVVTGGELGELRYIHSNRLNLGKVRREENILWSFAPHDISIITSLVGHEPVSVTTSGGAFLRDAVHDVTVTTLTFPGEIRGHIFVSWLHPYKEQRLTVVGSRRMAVFDDTLREGKLRIFDKGVEWDGEEPKLRNLHDHIVDVPSAEPLRRECEAFLTSVATRVQPLTGAENALRVLKVLEASQLSLDRGGTPVRLREVSETVSIG
jgi:predicted dehydrogenase